MSTKYTPHKSAGTNKPVISDEITREARGDHPVATSKTQPASAVLLQSRKRESAVMQYLPYF
jgi:hypothetical protein